MNFKFGIPDAGQVIAFSRHIGTSAATVVGTLAALKLISGGDAATLQSSIDQISHGFAEMAAGVSALAAVSMATIAALSANPIVQMLKGLLSIARDPAKIEEVKQGASIEQKAALVQTTNNLDSVKAIPLKDTDEGLAIQSIVPDPEVSVNPNILRN